MRTIHARLRHEVITLRLRPTTRLSENELALRFGTSRAPVREALIRLADEWEKVKRKLGQALKAMSLRAVLDLLPKRRRRNQNGSDEGQAGEKPLLRVDESVVKEAAGASGRT